MKGIVAALAALAVLILMVVIWPEPITGHAEAFKARPAGGLAVVGADKISDLESFAERGSKLTETPASLRGTVPDGELREDDAHRLLVTEGVRRRFDYFLSALGEEDLNVIRARVAAHIRKALSAKAAAQAWILFENYLNYRAELSTLPEHDGDIDTMRASLRARQALRQRWFDAATIDAFFGFQDRYAEFALDRRAILEDETLTEAQKGERLNTLTASLPADLQRMVSASRKPAEVARQVAELRADKASDVEVYEYREQALGRAAAERLGDLDHQRQRWASRYQAYRDQRAAIAHSGLAGADQEVEIQRLRERLFEEAERKRVEALDRIRSRSD
jgi:lipase chaperone LimK